MGSTGSSVYAARQSGQGWAWQGLAGHREARRVARREPELVAAAVQPPELADLGGKRVRWIATPHVPHGWEAGVFFEETTSTLLCGDLFTQVGDGPAVRTDSPMEQTITAEDMFGYSSLAPSTVPTVQRLADLSPTTLALMHGPTYQGDGAAWLGDLATEYRRRSDLTLAPA